MNRLPAVGALLLSCWALCATDRAWPQAKDGAPAPAVSPTPPVNAPTAGEAQPSRDGGSTAQSGPAETPAADNAAGTGESGQTPPGADDLDLRNLRNVFGLPEQEQNAAPQPAGVPRLPSPDVPFKTAVLRGLDKITARVSTFDAPIGQPVRFGTLSITARACKERPPTETPESTAYMEMQEIRPDEAVQPVFHGWMFASSPSLSALEHPVYDVWVIACKDPVNPPEPQPATAPESGSPVPTPASPPKPVPDDTAPPED